MFDEIVLTPHEKRVLFKMRFRKRSKLKGSDATALLDFELIQSNYSGEQNCIGECVSDGTYRLSGFYHRYRAYLRRDLFRRLVTPIFVSVASSVITAAITAIATVLLMGE